MMTGVELDDTGATIGIRLVGSVESVPSFPGWARAESEAVKSAASEWVACRPDAAVSERVEWEVA
jgi:hypothetical protein